MKNVWIATTIALLTGGCFSQMDMQGVDPKDYYAAHPIENKVENRHMLYALDFSADRSRLSSAAAAEFRSAMRDVSPAAVEDITITLAPSQMNNSERRQHIAGLLRSMGYATKKIHFVPMKGMLVREARVDVSYAAVISPRCPDWRTSPVTTNSNMPQGNFGCASAVNLGAMVADPHDLERGSGNGQMDSQRAAKAVSIYRSGDDIGVTSASSGGTSSTGSNTSDTGSSGDGAR